MVHLTDNEKKALLFLFKDFTEYHNANSLSKKLNISRVGTMKILKKMRKEGIVISKKIGKSNVYKLNLKNDYVRDLISFLLSDEANNFKRWKDEFKELFDGERVVMLYGSVIDNYSKAKDIDLMVIRKEKESSNIQKTISKKQSILPKEVHLIDLSKEEFIKNLKQKQESIIDIVKKAIILYGQKNYVNIIKNVTSI